MSIRLPRLYIHIHTHRLFRNCAGSVWALVPDQDQRGGRSNWVVIARQGSKQSNAFFYISPAGGSPSTAVGCCIDSNSLLLLLLPSHPRPLRSPNTIECLHHIALLGIAWRPACVRVCDHDAVRSVLPHLAAPCLTRSSRARTLWLPCVKALPSRWCLWPCKTPFLYRKKTYIQVRFRKKFI